MTKTRMLALQLITPVAFASAVGIAVSVVLAAAVLLLSAGGTA